MNGEGPPTEKRSADPRERDFEELDDDDIARLADAAERCADALERLVELRSL